MMVVLGEAANRSLRRKFSAAPWVKTTTARVGFGYPAIVLELEAVDDGIESEGVAGHGDS
jgi:hypothetical protein